MQDIEQHIGVGFGDFGQGNQVRVVVQLTMRRGQDDRERVSQRGRVLAQKVQHEQRRRWAERFRHAPAGVAADSERQPCSPRKEIVKQAAVEIKVICQRGEFGRDDLNMERFTERLVSGEGLDSRQAELVFKVDAKQSSSQIFRFARTEHHAVSLGNFNQILIPLAQMMRRRRKGLFVRVVDILGLVSSAKRINKRHAHSPQTSACE